MGERHDSSGKQSRPRTAPRGKRYLCAKCRTRSPRPVFTAAPWYCAKCRPTEPGEPPRAGGPSGPAG